MFVNIYVLIYEKNYVKGIILMKLNVRKFVIVKKLTNVFGFSK